MPLSRVALRILPLALASQVAGAQASSAAVPRLIDRLPPGDDFREMRVTVDTGVVVRATPNGVGSRARYDTTAWIALDPRATTNGMVFERRRSTGDTLYLTVKLPVDSVRVRQVELAIPWRRVVRVEEEIMNYAAAHEAHWRGVRRVGAVGAALGALVSPRTRAGGAGVGALLGAWFGVLFTGAPDDANRCFELRYDRAQEASRIAGGLPVYLDERVNVRCDVPALPRWRSP